MQIVKVDSRLLDYPMIVEDTVEWFTKKYGRSPRIKIRYGRKYYSSGRAEGSYYVTVTAGRSLKDFRHVLLHELAHSRTLTRGDIHGDRFYKAFAEMAKSWNISMTDLIEREKNYKPRAVNKLARRHRIKLEAA